MADLRQIALSIAQDLMTLEVNTVLKPGMTARKPPAYPLLLREIAEKYVSVLMQFETGPALQTPNSGEAPKISDALSDLTSRFPKVEGHDDQSLADAIYNLHPPTDAASFEKKIDTQQQPSVAATSDKKAKKYPDDYVGVHLWIDVFDACAEVAEKLLTHTPAESRAHAPLRRIARESRWLQAFLRWQHLPAPSLDKNLPAQGRGMDLQPEDRMHLRKIWDLGGERVVMQTTIHLDGDVLNGIDPALLLHPQFEAVKALHADGVGTALTHWRALFEAICTAFGKLGDAFSNVLDKRRG